MAEADKNSPSISNKGKKGSKMYTMKTREELLERLATWDQLRSDSVTSQMAVLHAQLRWLVDFDTDHSWFPCSQVRFTARLMLGTLSDGVARNAYRGAYTLAETREFVSREISRLQTTTRQPP